MQRIFGIIRQASRKTILILSLVSLVSLSSLLIFFNQPSYAAQKVTPEEEFQRAQSSESPDVREEAYEEATQEAKSPRNEQKAYERNLKGYQEKNSGGG